MQALVLAGPEGVEAAPVLSSAHEAIVFLTC
jgi:hypothetical protein